MAITYTHWRQDPYWQREMQKRRTTSAKTEQATPPVKPTEEPSKTSSRCQPQRRNNVSKLLSDGEWHTTAEITSPSVGGPQGARRLRELRAQQQHGGYRIEKRKVTNSSQFEYRMVAV